MAALHFFREMISAQKAGKPRGVYSICSANRFVVAAAMLFSKRKNLFVCIESTSNQVDQFGGYTGMTPQYFVNYIYAIAGQTGFPRDKIILGGDHLGPNVWQKETEGPAMEKAKALMRDYILAGYTKIHLDASMRLASDPEGPLAEEVIARRAAELCAVCEDTYAGLHLAQPMALPPIYIIGTEVPLPGGAQETEDTLQVTKVEDAQRTIAVAEEVFNALSLHEAWKRVVGLVVQPGVEFGDHTVHGYQREKARALSQFIRERKTLVYEAHSTDYQSRKGLRELVEDQFCILKVGPALTFAMREALFALAHMEEELLVSKKGVTLSHLQEELEKTMTSDPVHWKKHYHGSEEDKKYSRKYSFSDRSRYYWPNADLEKAVGLLIANLEKHPVPLTLLSQYMPGQYKRVRNEALATNPTALIYDRIMEAIDDYAYAVGVSY
ncbi:MAG: tagatose-bisphosphate aldolase [Candidatus Raymondbacteria bacterium RifOxyA12_full_50_37]|uniref:Tagatose-bisphosphate aldolase n=1 Tax=Candidatus Raymondbacteria bacterium RIFOXYD12_FULL_49_13 TaxID=1817890 RepID=A0A1F7F248_UNCRA|nr:MAG: tagatose-bisphosphate aldolase [Candidatus Raymondbacteria bacterium RifOxyA12_full_50_37]OGJ92728.1 MAG: tagatose-bisphosphate aldolase [Candidatus Raymondbacteria bacterium RIFOXYA2_FULL_49_16]OGJ95921.1 MAG: tagatose-bisphosphate aldolase [Candidatus Raymondbacteria bacterium RifOxyC12_full_50_8]OGK00740.1 MAG: tagatose-bisphosphate aldolase [Candidatus Raymondbacteria bacterium RIFOXYD12_FULL_49_13]OGK04193.1 MAG: tagatose-bisphosphate aldolase [Candidatus Raymondbacteria bacterium 